MNTIQQVDHMAMPIPRFQQNAQLSTVDEGLKKEWDKAIERFNKKSRKNLKAKAHYERSLETVLEEFERKYQAKDEEDRSTKAKIGDTIRQILSCVQILGGLAAQGASIVFGPANLCFNAVSFLVDVSSKIAAVYRGIGNLFDEVARFLVQFQIYREYNKMDKALLNSVHKTLMSLVDICGLSIEYINGNIGHQITIGLKVTFLNDDSGIKSALVKFKALVDEQHDITGALTLKNVLTTELKMAEVLKNQCLAAETLDDIQSDMKFVVDDVTEGKERRLAEERMQKIARLLKVSEELVHTNREPLQRMKDKLLQESSKWLLNGQGDYNDWTSPDSDSPRLLLIYGEPKTGKSFLVASIEKDLREKYPDMAIAYYSFSTHDAKSAKHSDIDEVVPALKSLALQLAKQSKPYAKALAALKESDFEKETPEQCWTKLQFSKDSKIIEVVNIVFMFDGLDNLSKKNTEKLLGLLRDRSKLRILATGDQGTEGALFNQVAIKIKIVDHNEDDIKLYLERELALDEVLQGEHVEMLDLLKSIRERLPAVANGSFNVVEQKLKRIREAVESDAYPDDVAPIMDEDPAGDVDKIAQKVIHDLNATLDAHDIQQLNELLKWTIFRLGYSPFTTDELGAVICLNSGKLPVQSLVKKLQNKYQKVFDIEDGDVIVKEDIEQLFRASKTPLKLFKPHREIAPDYDDAKITMTISINQADHRTVQQFCWDLTERVGIGHFDFLAAKSNSDSQGDIQCDEVTSHYHLASKLLQLLNDEPQEKTKPLVGYALEYLPCHLREVKQALDEGQLEESARSVIAKRLVDLLSDVEGIEKFWSNSSSVSDEWADDEAECLNLIQSLLTEEKTMAVLDPKERRWVRQHTSEVEGRGGIYKPITLMIARRWLQDRSWDAYDTYKWINWFIGLQSAQDEEKHGTTNTGDESSQLPVDANDHDFNNDKDGSSDEAIQLSTTSFLPASVDKPDNDNISEVIQSEPIATAAKWVQEVLNVREVDSLWCERIGQTYYQVENCQGAIQWFDKAKSLPDCNWKVHEGLALAYRGLALEYGDFDEQDHEHGTNTESACREMKETLTALRSLRKDGGQAEEYREALIINLKRYASWQEELKATDRALELYDEVLQINPLDFENFCALLKLLYQHKRVEEARERLRRIQSVDQPGKSNDLDAYSKFLRKISGDEDDLEDLDIVIYLVQQDQALSQNTLKSIQSVINHAGQNSLTTNQGILLLYQGIIYARRGTIDSVLLEKALRSWEECQCVYCDDYSLMYTHQRAEYFITQHHFHQAVKSRTGTETTDEHLNRLLKMYRIAKSKTYPGDTEPACFLSSYYLHLNKPEEARKLFIDKVKDAIAILSDGDPENDPYGYVSLAEIFLHTGDDANALIAYSMLSPKKSQGSPESEEEEDSPEPLFSFICDGDCKRTWSYTDDIYMCHHCPDRGFTGDCLEKLKENKLQAYFCSPEHSWLKIPAWSHEDGLDAGEGKIRVPSTLNDGNRVEGKIIDLQVWLDGICEKWGLPKITEGGISGTSNIEDH